MPLSVRPWTDEELLHHIRTDRFEEVTRRCAHELGKRLASGFVVRDVFRGRYVESVDPADLSVTEFTDDRSAAKVFTGEEWILFWSKADVRLEAVGKKSAC